MACHFFPHPLLPLPLLDFIEIVVSLVVVSPFNGTVLLEALAEDDSAPTAHIQRGISLQFPVYPSFKLQCTKTTDQQMSVFVLQQPRPVLVSHPTLALNRHRGADGLLEGRGEGRGIVVGDRPVDVSHVGRVLRHLPLEVLPVDGGNVERANTRGEAEVGGI